MPRKKKAVLKLKAWPIITEAIEQGIRGGIYKALKWGADFDKPDAVESALPTIMNYVECALEEVIDWEKSG